MKNGKKTRVIYLNLYTFLKQRLYLALIGIVFLSSSPSECAFSKRTLDDAKNSNVLVAISAFYDSSRLQYLSKVLSSLSAFPKADIIILTNTFDKNELASLKTLCENAIPDPKKGVTANIRSYDVRTDGFFLTWLHKPIISHEFVGSNYSHFIYIEDDMEFKFDNFCYFIEYRNRLRKLGLLPSFLRVEYHNGINDFTNTDNSGLCKISEQPHVMIDDLYFVNLPNPYTACFVLDQELAIEYIQTPSFDVKRSLQSSGWNIRERSAMGLCFEHVPRGFQSRYVVAVSKDTSSAPKCTWVAHLPNNYANIHPHYGSRRMSELFMLP